MSNALALGITGIVVSGVVGPSVAAWFSRRGDQARFARDQSQRRGEDLRAILDEAAMTLGVGETNLRLAHEAAARGEVEPAEVKEWASQVHLLGQRLLLRLSADDPVVSSYEGVREALLQVGKTYGDDHRYTATVATFESRRSEFLDKAREALARTSTR